MLEKYMKCRVGELCKLPHVGGDCDKHCYYNTHKATTNADRIRAMTDEELAEWIAELTDCAVYPYTRKDAPCISIGQTCAACWLDWLRQEAVSDG